MPSFQVVNTQPDLIITQDHQSHLKVWTYEMFHKHQTTVEITDRLYMETLTFLSGKDENRISNFKKSAETLN